MICCLKAMDDPPQIDHVIVSTYGVFVIGTKGYKGWILEEKTLILDTDNIQKQASVL